jgi:hypothetical protein
VEWREHVTSQRFDPVFIGPGRGGVMVKWHVNGDNGIGIKGEEEGG